MAIGMIPIYHTDKIKQPFNHLHNFYYVEVEVLISVTCTVQPALITTRCEGHTCGGVGNKKLHSYNSH